MAATKQAGSAEVPATEQRAYEELQAYTLGLGDPAFLHQILVDAWALRHADEGTRPMALAFSLASLYLHFDRGFTGREAQRVHMLLAGRKRQWPQLALPEARGAITASQVLAAPPGEVRNRAIEAWAAEVWAAYGDSHQAIAELLARLGIG